VYNAVDPDDYHPVPARADDACDILYVADAHMDVAVSAAEHAPDLSFVLAGPIEADADTLPPNVRVIGVLSAAEQRRWYSSARVVLNVEDSAGGFSPRASLFQAAACGCCIVALDT